MIPFAHDDFLLGTRVARTLYHEHAAPLPIIDYHSHVNVADLHAARTFPELTALWIAPDQYKHRAMRGLGIAEDYITGPASPREKFERWAAAVPLTAGNPLFHWTALELKRFFGIDELLNPQTAAGIWERCHAQLQQPSHHARGLLERSRVAYVASSDRWLDDLSLHRELVGKSATRVVPSLRADDALAVGEPGFARWVAELGTATGLAIRDLATLQAALQQRLDAFAAAGCTVADHGIDVLTFATVDEATADRLLRDVLAGRALEAADSARLSSHLLLTLGREYARRDWVMLLHLGAHRHTSSRWRRIAGAAGGYAAIGPATDIQALTALLDTLDRDDQLPRTVLFNLNPSDNAAFATLAGSFARPGTAGRVQFGPAWWFNDHDRGIRDHLDNASRYGLLSTFVGMTTDSRSLLSMSRHEYFRRIFCDYLGEQVGRGIIPDDEALLAELVRRVCHDNARAWFAPTLKSL